MAVRSPRAFRRILVPVSNAQACEQAMPVACRLAAEHGAEITVLAAVEVPPGLPIDALMPEAEAEARRVIGEAQAIAELYGVAARPRVVRAREAGEAIVEAAAGNRSELVVLAAPRVGRTAALVLRRAQCRVLLCRSH